MNVERPILIIDSMNLFVRAHAAYPSMSTHGYQMGGTIGFLKTLKRLVTELSPSVVYVVWEGGGSSRRRALFSEYKMNRKPEKLNRFYEDDIPDTEENKKHQLLTLVEMMKGVPVCQLYTSDCEADDVVAYLCRQKFRGVEKVVASSDKDMYQLLDDKTRVYSFHKKTYVTVDDVTKEFNIHAKNFALAKAVCGDTSDNIDGVKGIGFKTLAKLFPIVSLEQDVLIDDLIKYCHSHSEESSSFRKILDNEEKIKRNWRLVYLDGSMLSQSQAGQIDRLIDSYAPKSDRMKFVKVLIREGLGDFNTEEFFYAFNCIDGI